MNGEILLNDIAETLLILDKRTVDALYKTDDPSGCVGLYMFYYKTAKWQKTNRVKANDVYVKKCLKIGNDRLKTLKGMLKNEGLIQIVQNRKNGKITGWYVEVSYLVSQAKTDIKVDSHNNTSNQQVVNPTGSIQETNALKQYIKCLKKEIEVLKKGKAKKETITKETIQKKEGIQKNPFWDTEKENEQKQKTCYENLQADYKQSDIDGYIEKYNSWVISTDKKSKIPALAIRKWLINDGVAKKPNESQINVHEIARKANFSRWAWETDESYFAKIERWVAEGLDKQHDPVTRKWTDQASEKKATAIAISVKQEYCNA